MQKSLCSSFANSLKLLFLLFAVVPVLRAAITVEVQSLSAPVGTTAHPFYVIDSDADKPGAAYDLDAVPVTASVKFTGNIGESGKYRISATLIDVESGDPVALVGDGISEAKTVLLLAPAGTPNPISRTLDFSVRLKPDADLGAGKKYRVKVAVSKFLGYLQGTNFELWQSAAGPENSADFTLIHFRDLPIDTGKTWARGYPAGGVTWQRTYRLQTDGSRQTFTAKIPYFYARYMAQLPQFTPTQIDVRLTATLKDENGTEIPLVDGGVMTQKLPLNPRVWDPLQGRYLPATMSGSLVANVKPLAQLDSANHTYTLELKLEHRETTTQWFDDGTASAPGGQRLLDFNGTIAFGSHSGTLAEMEDSPAATGNPQNGGIPVSLTPVSGTVQLAGTDYDFGPRSAALVGHLLANGNLALAFGSVKISDLPAIQVGGTTVHYDAVVVGASGELTGQNANVTLPQGLSWTPNRANSHGKFLSEIVIPGSRPIAPDLRPVSYFQFSLASDSWVFDESRPLLYEVSLVRLESDGKVNFSATQVEYARAAAEQVLADNETNGDHETPEMAYRASNDSYLKHAHLSSTRTVSFAAASDGSARTSADLDFEPGWAVMHFPRQSAVGWQSPASVALVDGSYDTSAKFTNAVPFAVAFNGACDDSPCSPAAGAATTVTVAPANGELRLTPDGGLYATASLHNWGRPDLKLQWGIRADANGNPGSYTHQASGFTNFEFFAPGNQLYAAANSLAALPQYADSYGYQAAAILLNEGYQAATNEFELPETAAYQIGAGAYAGLNMRASSGNAGASRLAGSTTDYTYQLHAQSKYYLRPSGVSGRHAAIDGSYGPNLQMYGYQFSLTSFQLTYLSNKNDDSWVNGNVVVPSPSDFGLDFDGLKLTCTGDLSDAEVADTNGPKPLAYWQGEFTPLTVAFRPTEDAACGDARFLTLGVLSGASNIDTPLAGTLAFKPNGNIATAADKVVGADGRLGLPATVMMSGPGDSAYPLNPVGNLYFNNPEASGNKAPTTGFVSFAATCKVPFFEALKVHVSTSANHKSPANLYLAGGWENGGESFFSNRYFDADHRGFPTGISADDYRAPSAENSYAVHANQSLFGLVGLDYPLRWNPTARYFTSWSPQRNDLLVINVEHQVDFLSATDAELSFGAQYDGLPEINLVSSAYSIIDEKLGAAKALTDAATSFVTETLNDGVDALGNLVTDQAEPLLDGVLDRIESEVIDPLYNALYNSLQEVIDTHGDLSGVGDWINPDTGAIKGIFDEYFEGSVGAASQDLKSLLGDLASAGDAANNLIGHVDDALARGILAIDSVAGELQTYRDNAGNHVVALTAPSGFTADTIVSGIFAKVDVGNNRLERQIASALTRRLIEELAPDHLVATLQPYLNDLSSDLNAKLNALLEEFDPTLDRINEALMEARGYLVDLRERLEPGKELIQNFQAIINQAEAEIDQLVTSVHQVAHAYIERLVPLATVGTRGLPELSNPLDQIDKDAFIAEIRAEIRDQLLQTEFVRQIQYTLRQYITELDLAVRSAIDSGFAEVNRMIKELVRDALGPIDDTINDMIGDINDVVGAGSIDGYAHIQGDTLKRLRLDAQVEFKVPDSMTLQAYLEMVCFDSSEEGHGCVDPGEMATEVTIGALDIPIDWLDPGVRATVEARFSLTTSASGHTYPSGMGGGLTMTKGTIDFQGTQITEFAAGLGFGAREAYLAATARLVVSDYEAAGGIFFGKTCQIEPLALVDPDVADLLGQPPFTGAYVYGEVWLPISEALLGIPSSCFFRISAGVGAGAFYFAEGPTYGGKILLGVSGEALCVVSVKGEVEMTGVMQNGNLNYKGTGRITGKAGACPFCVKFGKSATLRYQNNSWSVSL